MKKFFLLFMGILTLFMACIGDDIVNDFVPPAVKIMNPLDTLGKDETWQFEAKFTNNVGVEEDLPLQWSSSDPAVLGISAGGLATGLAKGIAVVKVEATYEGTTVSDELSVVVDEETVVSPTTRSGEIKSTSSYLLKGSFVMEKEGNGVKISIADGYMASTALPGLYVYLGNNPNSISAALEIGKVNVFNGAHSYTVEGVGLNDYTHLLYWCKPFNVKVGEGKIE
jgi:hypothetical protein